MSFQLNRQPLYRQFVTDDLAKANEIGEELVHLHQSAVTILEEGDEKRYEYCLDRISRYEKRLKEVETSLREHQIQLVVEILKSERYQTRHVLRQISLLTEELDRASREWEKCHCWECSGTDLFESDWETYEGKEGIYCGYCCDEDGEPYVTCEECERSLFIEKDMKLIEPGVWDMCLRCWEEKEREDSNEIEQNCGEEGYKCGECTYCVRTKPCECGCGYLGGTCEEQTNKNQAE